MIGLRKKCIFITLLRSSHFFLTWLKLHCDVMEKTVTDKKHEVKMSVFFVYQIISDNRN